MLGREIYLCDEFIDNTVFIAMLGKDKIKYSEYCSSFEAANGKVELAYGDAKLATVASFSTVSPTIPVTVEELEQYLFEKASLKYPIPVVNVFKVVCNNDFEYYLVDDTRTSEIHICVDEYFWRRNRSKYLKK